MKGWYGYYWLSMVVHLLHLRSRPGTPLIVFDYKDGIYADVYINIYRELKQDEEVRDRLLVAFSDVNVAWHRDRRFDRTDFAPEWILRFVKRYVLISASVVHEDHRSHHRDVRMVQVTHSPGSFGTVFGAEMVRGFDRVFAVTPFQIAQLKEEPYRSLLPPDAVVPVGFPKIDGPVAPRGASDVPDPARTIFYGPTYHRDISSIFCFLDPVIAYARQRDLRLIIQLHPLLYKQYHLEYSGGIDWERRLKEAAKRYPFIEYLSPNTPFEELRARFTSIDYAITDNSGIGYEFCLITGRPVVFLGEKLKVPESEQTPEILRKYSAFPEIDYRGKLGPLVVDPSELHAALDALPVQFTLYRECIERFREGFMFNLGAAAPVAASEIRKLADALEGESRDRPS